MVSQTASPSHDQIPSDTVLADIDTWLRDHGFDRSQPPSDHSGSLSFAGVHFSEPETTVWYVAKQWELEKRSSCSHPVRERGKFVESFYADYTWNRDGFPRERRDQQHHFDDFEENGRLVEEV